MTDYDNIVIGAGSAGAVIAARLTEDPSRRVLLLEAGGRDTLETLAVPPAWPAHWGSEVDWNYETTPQTGTAGTAHAWPRGKVLGGSSSINAMVFIRGHRTNFDAWEAAGATGWGYDDVLPYFKRLEDVPDGDPGYRGAGGPLRVAPGSNLHPLSPLFVSAAAEAGHPTSTDVNGAVSVGASLHDLTVHDGLRESSSTAFLRTAEGRANLTVLTGATANRLIIEGGKCVGVRFELDGRVQEVRCDGDVIVSGGAINSPVLLMQSGIGPADHLRSLGIPVIADLPGVGSNLHDHPMSGVIYEASQELPVSANNHAEASLLTSSSLAGDEPDLQFMFITVPFHPPTVTAPANSYTIGVAVMTPTSRGSVRLRSARDGDMPLIDPAYLSTDRDVARMLEGFAIAREIGQMSAFDSWRLREVLPGSDAKTVEQLRAHLAVSTGTYYHPVGTCRIGQDHDSVVDPSLRVHGIAGLRVADASVMPSIVSANTNPAALMIGERAAALMKETSTGSRSQELAGAQA